MKPAILSLVVLGFGAGCDTTTDSHLPNPLTLPAHALNAGLNNAFYNARRHRVERYVAQQQSAILKDARLGGGTALFQAMSLARVRPAGQVALLDALQSDMQLYGQDADALVVALMVHGDPRP